jgi:uncharacterized protein YbjT (DUF2867 family)
MIYVTGATGYLGKALIAALLERGHAVRGLVRPGSEGKLPGGCEAATGNVLDGATWGHTVSPASTLVHLVGTPKPAPWKEKEFRAVDRASLFAAVDAAVAAKVEHFVYVSVAQPAPVMASYIRVRAECEAHLRVSGLNATILRPWYIIGPGHWWPLALVPIYKVMEAIPSTRDNAIRLGLVRHPEMIRALVKAVENPVKGQVIWETKEIRAS